MKEKPYLMFKDHMGYDEFFVPLDTKDKTWKSVLSEIESVLDDRFLDNDCKMPGISLEMEIVMKDPTTIEFDGERT